VESDTPEVSTAPFYWKGGPAGCLLLHGLTGTPYEMRFLGERLHAAGYTVHAVRLAGHGTRVEELEQTGSAQWYRSVERGLDRLRNDCRWVVVAGLSLGSLLALRLAHRRAEHLSAVVVLATALALWSEWPARLAGPVRLAWRFLPRAWRFRPKNGSDIADVTARQVHPGYRFMPLRSVAELVALQDELKPALAEIRLPVLALHGRNDHTTPLEKNLPLLRRELADLRRAVILEQSCHVISVDRERERVAGEVLEFLREVGL